MKFAKRQELILFLNQVLTNPTRIGFFATLKKMGVGVMTDARWKATRDFMVGAGLLNAKTNWKSAYTTQFVNTAKK